MAEMKIIIQKIERIEEHPNADRLEIAFTDTFDWPVIIGKDSFEIGDKVIHFPVDCVVDEKMEDLLLGGSKLKLKNGRIRAAKIRGIISYGILAPWSKIINTYDVTDKETNLMKIIGCKKYEPPVKALSPRSNTNPKSKKTVNRNFTKYFDMNHLQNCKGIFNDEDVVIVTEKLHGTSFRAGWVKRDISTLWDKIKLYIRKLWDKEYKWEFVYGSRNVQLQDKKSNDNFYKENVYSKMVEKYNLKSLPKGIVLYAEITGPGIQKNYQYTEDHEMFVYDIKDQGEYCNVPDRFNFCWGEKLRLVPLLEGDVNFDGNINGNGITSDVCNPQFYFDDDSSFELGKFPIEGIVIETFNNEICRFGRKKVKVLNPEYLLNKTNTDFH